MSIFGLISEFPSSFLGHFTDILLVTQKSRLKSYLSCLIRENKIRARFWYPFGYLMLFAFWLRNLDVSLKLRELLKSLFCFAPILGLAWHDIYLLANRVLRICMLKDLSWLGVDLKVVCSRGTELSLVARLQSHFLCHWSTFWACA